MVTIVNDDDDWECLFIFISTHPFPAAEPSIFFRTKQHQTAG